jgi:hypothetical protein
MAVSCKNSIGQPWILTEGERGQRVVIKFLWLQEQESHPIHTHLHGILEDIAVPPPTVTRLLRRFRQGNTSCPDRNRSRRPLIVSGDVLSKFVPKYPFASVKNFANHFGIRISTVKKPLMPELGLRKLTGTWVTHSLSEAEEKNRSIKLLLDLLWQHQTADFTEMQSKLSPGSNTYIPLAGCLSETGRQSYFASALGSAPRMLWSRILAGTRLFILKALPKGREFN